MVSSGQRYKIHLPVPSSLINTSLHLASYEISHVRDDTWLLNGDYLLYHYLWTSGCVYLLAELVEFNDHQIGNVTQ